MKHLGTLSECQTVQNQIRTNVQKKIKYLMSPISIRQRNAKLDLRGSRVGSQGVRTPPPPLENHKSGGEFT